MALDNNSHGASTQLPPPLATRTFAVLLALIALLAFALRLFKLARLELWLDEQYAFLNYFGFDVKSYDSYLPTALTYGLMWFLSDSSNLVLRLPSAVTASLSVPFLGLLAAQFGSRRAALFAAGLAAISPHQIVWAQMSRPYGFLMLGTAVLLWQFFRVYPLFVRAGIIRANEATDPPQTSGRPLYLWTCYGLAVLFATNCHANIAHILIGIGACLSYEAYRQPALRKQLLIFGTVTAVAALPSLYYLLDRRSSAHISEVLRLFQFELGLHYLLADVVIFFGPSPFVRNYQSVTLVCTSVLLVMLFAFALRARVPEYTWRMQRILLVCIAVAVGSTIFFLGEKAHWPWGRYIVHVQLLAYVFCGYGCLYLGRTAWGANSCFALLALLFAIHGSFSARPTYASQWEINKFELPYHRHDMVGVRGYIMTDLAPALAGVGRIVGSRRPVFVAGSSKAKTGGKHDKIYETRWIGKPSLALILLKGEEVATLRPGKYLIDSVNAAYRCHKIVGGRLGERVLNTKWRVCQVHE